MVNGLINVEFLEKNNTCKRIILVKAYLVSVTEIISTCQQSGIGGFSSENGFLLGFLKKQGFCLFDSHNKNENNNISVEGTAFLIRFVSFSSLENYRR